MEVNEEDINIKNLYEKFRWTNSHGLVSSQFLGALNIFFGGNPEISQKMLTKSYQNMTVSNLSTDDSIVFDGFTDLISEINLMLRGLGNNENETIKKEDDTPILKLKQNMKLMKIYPHLILLRQ